MDSKTLKHYLVDLILGMVTDPAKFEQGQTALEAVENRVMAAKAQFMRDNRSSTKVCTIIKKIKNYSFF